MFMSLKRTRPGCRRLLYEIATSHHLYWKIILVVTPLKTKKKPKILHEKSTHKQLEEEATLILGHVMLSPIFFCQETSLELQPRIVPNPWQIEVGPSSMEKFAFLIHQSEVVELVFRMRCKSARWLLPRWNTTLSNLVAIKLIHQFNQAPFLLQQRHLTRNVFLTFYSSSTSRIRR